MFNAHYLLHADEGCTAFFAARGTPYADLLSPRARPVVKASTLTCVAAPGPLRRRRRGRRRAGRRAGRTSFTLLLSVRVGGARGGLRPAATYVVVGHDGRPTPLPDDLVCRRAWT